MKMDPGKQDTPASHGAAELGTDLFLQREPAHAHTCKAFRNHATRNTFFSFRFVFAVSAFVRNHSFVQEQECILYRNACAPATRDAFFHIAPNAMLCVYDIACGNVCIALRVAMGVTVWFRAMVPCNGSVQCTCTNDAQYHNAIIALHFTTRFTTM